MSAARSSKAISGVEERTQDKRRCSKGSDAKGTHRRLKPVSSANAT